MKSKLPPYGWRLHQFLQLGNKPKNDIYLFMGNRCWDAAQMHNRNKFALCLPPEKNPFNYDWPIQDCDILIFDGSPRKEEFIQLLASCLFSYSANIIRYISSENKMTIFKKEL